MIRAVLALLVALYIHAVVVDRALAQGEMTCGLGEACGIMSTLTQHSGDPFPAGEPITFTTSLGTFANGQQVFVGTTNANGQAFATVSSNTAGTAYVTSSPTYGAIGELVIVFQPEAPTATPEAPTATATAIPPTPIPTVILEFGDVVFQSGTLITEASAMGDEGPIQYLILAFGALLIGFGLLYFLVGVIRSWPND